MFNSLSSGESWKCSVMSAQVQLSGSEFRTGLILLKVCQTMHFGNT